MEIRSIDKASQGDIRLKNEPFDLFGRLIPACREGQWSFREELFPEDQVSRMCFPEENYDFETLAENTVFLGAYEEGKCVGLAILQTAWFRYMYLYDLKVSEAFRRKGVAAALMEKAEEVAAERGYRGIYAICQDNNLGACRFYLKQGFQIGGFDNRVYRGTNQEDKADIYFYRDRIR